MHLYHLFFRIIFLVHSYRIIMPQPNVNVVLGTGAIIVVTVVAAAAIAVYESPEIRQFAEECRRRIAIALHSLGDEINPRSQSESQQPRYNRPEDAEGFLQSSAETGVEADEASRRRQREELMYWNQIRLEKMQKEKEKGQDKEQNRTRGSSFDDFLHEDKTAEKGTYVYNSGANVYGDAEEGLLRRRGEGVRGLDRGSAFANPFSDENQIEMDEQRATDRSLMSPEHSELSEDIYGASDDIKPSRESTNTLGHDEQLVDVSEPTALPSLPELVSEPLSYPAIQELPTNSYHEDTYMAGQDGESAYASIHACADNSHHASFYSPLPVTPAAPLSVASEPEFLDGQATPTDSASMAGSGEDVGRDDASSVNDVMSEDGDGMNTPGSWTEVGSVVSESDAGHRL
jgi:hypothetical protein